MTTYRLSQRQYCHCTGVGGRDHYAPRCRRCGLSRSSRVRPAYQLPPGSRQAYDDTVAALDAALTTLPLHWEHRSIPAQWRGIEEWRLVGDPAYRSWSHRSADWEAAANAAILAQHEAAAKLAREALSGNRATRREATRLLAPWLSALHELCAIGHVRDPWERVTT